jgi:AraC-like DNA-binding protein
MTFDVRWTTNIGSVVWYHGRVTREASESVTVIRRLIQTAERYGLTLDEGPTAREPAFSSRVPLSHAHRLWERAVRVVGPSLPLLVAASHDEQLCLLGFAARSCATIGEALRLTAEHWRYVTDACPASVVRRDGAVHLRLATGGPMALGARLAMEHRLAALARAGRALSGGAWRPTAIVLGHRPPIDRDAWEAVCGVPVRVAREPPGLVIAESSLAQPVRAGLSREAGRFFVELLEWYTPRPHAAPSVGERVRHALARNLAAVAPTVEQVAAELALSARSLHRQLAAEGTSYQRLLDDVRCSEAIRQALDDHRPFKAIAAAVGFADPRAFRRAFKRWTGTSPQQFRMRRAGQTDDSGEDDEADEPDFDG